MKKAMSSLMLVAGLAMIPTLQAEQRPTYGPQLEGFSYPHPIERFEFSSQRQTLSMGYMDVKPARQANGRTVVLMHGKNFCAATWEQSIAVLAQNGYRVIAPDQIGFCSSSKPEGYQFSFAQLAHNTQALLASLDIDQVTLIGHSMGGMLASRFALNYPQVVEQLVLVNPIGLEDWQAEGVPYASIDDLYEGELYTDFDKIKTYQQKFYYNGDWKPQYDRWVDMLAGMYAGDGKALVAWNQAQTSEMLFTQPVIHEFGKLRMPTLLLIGGKDRTAPGANRAPGALAQRLGNYPELGRRAAAMIPDATLVPFPELGHSPQVEAPEVFHKALLKGLGSR